MQRPRKARRQSSTSSELGALYMLMKSEREAREEAAAAREATALAIAREDRNAQFELRREELALRRLELEIKSRELALEEAKGKG